MKKLVFIAIWTLGIMSVNAQKTATMENKEITKGKMDVFDCGTFKLHVYNTNDAMGDASYIIEGKNGLVLMELPLFKENANEFEHYYESLNKPVEKVVTDYHLGGTKKVKTTMPEGMPTFIKGPVYGGMMQHFSGIFGDAMVELPDNETEEVPFGSSQTWVGVKFSFKHGASSDFPAASINIGGKAYYTHWTPMKAHMSNLQISSPAAIDAEIEEAQNALNSGCVIFIGGHGGAAKKEDVEFKINYLKVMKKAVATNKTPDAFMEVMKKEFPKLSGENNLTEVANAMYKK